MVNILGINISTLNREELFKKIIELTNDGQHYLVTPNPEIVLASHQDEEYFYLLNQADLAPADGFGLVIAGRLAGKKIPRITGSDLTPQLLNEAAEKDWPVSILNWCGGLSSAADIHKVLCEKWPKLKFQIIDLEKTVVLPEEILASLNNFSPKILFCSFGAPFQEKVIYHNLKKIPSVNLAIANGGSFDFLTKKAIRAPRIFRKIGLEWLWRVIKQPKRIKRIWRATAVFLWKIFLWRFINPHRYRPNVSCLMVRKNNNIWEALLVERAEPRGHWQIPQGGTDGESAEKAGLRELREETGVKNLLVRGVWKNAYKYRFFKSDYRGTNNNTPRHFDYRGQKQSFLVAEMANPNEEIKINFWDHADWRFVPLNQLVEEVHPVRKEAMEKILNFAKKVLN